MIQKLRNRQRGFTLIELLIVVAIIAILAPSDPVRRLDALSESDLKEAILGAAVVCNALTRREGGKLLDVCQVQRFV